MDAIEECSAGRGSRILVGVPRGAGACSELLAWAVGVAARPGDAVIALHVLGGKEEKSRLRRANAFVISILGEFVDACEAKQVNLEAKVMSSSSIGRGLIEEATWTKANFLVIGRSRNATVRHHFQIASYCFMHAPKGCSVVAIGRQGLPRFDSELKNPQTSEASNISSTSARSKNFSPIQRLFKAYSRRERARSLSESNGDKSSPRAVLDGPEEGEQQVAEECYSPSSNGASRHGKHNGIWRRLSDIKLWLPFLRSVDDESMKGSDVGSTCTEDQKPLWRCFNYQEISLATNEFHPDNMVGRGGYAEVYKGVLEDGQCVAVKRLAKGKANEQKEKEFLAELGILGHVCHPNTAYLTGCCFENGLYLIFEFCPNGTLASALHGSNSGEVLGWHLRYKIAVGVARGLQYLHQRCRHRIIHRDIKASNVLLGDDFEPQISDFGLAKWLPKQWTHHSVIPIEGTFGYLAPEYFMHGIVDEKTDVFAYGVLLLEIVTGRRPVDCSKMSLLQWAKPLLEAGQVTELADPKLGDDYDKEQLKRLVKTASRCITRPPMWRPSMAEVLHSLSTDQCLKTPEKWNIPEDEVEDMDDCTIISECCSPPHYLN